MANFLSRLASRAVGVANVAQPIVPALFTPGSGLERSETSPDLAGERIANPREGRSVPSESVRRATLPGPVESLDSHTSPRGSIHAPRLESLADQGEPASQIHQEQLPMSANAMDATLPAAPRTLINSREETQPAEAERYKHGTFSVSPIEPSGIEAAEDRLSGSIRPKRAEPTITQEAAQTRGQAPGTFRLGPTIPTNPRTMSARRDQASMVERDAPVIRVTIGRIDVRAQFPAPAPAPAARHARPAAISLDEYLKQRSEGKR
jgi:hypothetical protein